jgi:hypothetical protein
MPQFFHHFVVKLSAIASHIPYTKKLSSFSSPSSDKPTVLPTHEPKAAPKKFRHPNDLTTVDGSYADLNTTASSVWGLNAKSPTTTLINAEPQQHRYESSSTDVSSTEGIVRTTKVEQFV